MEKTERTEKAQKRMLEALHKTMGVVTPALHSANVSRTQYYKWLKVDKEFKKDVDTLPEIALDFVESRLYQLIDAGNPTSILFYLKTKGKHRGYIEEYTGDVNFTVRIIEPGGPVDE